MKITLSEQTKNNYYYLRGKETLTEEEKLELEILIPLIKEYYSNRPNLDYRKSDLDKKLELFRLSIN